MTGTHDTAIVPNNDYCSTFSSKCQGRYFRNYRVWCILSGLWRTTAFSREVQTFCPNPNLGAANRNVYSCALLHELLSLSPWTSGFSCTLQAFFSWDGFKNLWRHCKKAGCWWQHDHSSALVGWLGFEIRCSHTQTAESGTPGSRDKIQCRFYAWHAQIFCHVHRKCAWIQINEFT